MGMKWNGGSLGAFDLVWYLGEHGDCGGVA